MTEEPRWVLVGRWIIDRLPKAWVNRFDAWVNRPPPPQCEWKSAFGRQCEYNKGHGGTCLTQGPGSYLRSWYGVNYDMIEGIPLPKNRILK